MPLTFRKRPLPPLSQPRANATLVPLGDGRALLAGGSTRRAGAPRTGECEIACASSPRVDLIDPARTTTTHLATLSHPRESAAAHLTPEGVLFAFGYADHS